MLSFNRYGHCLIFSLCLLGATSLHGYGQDAPVIADTVVVQPYQSEGASIPGFSPDGLGCPSNVPVGKTAVAFTGEVTTTSETGISYEVQIRYGSGSGGAKLNGDGALEHADLSTSIGSWEVSSGTSETLLLLSVTVTASQPLQWAASLVALAAGTVFYTFQTPFRTETCTFENTEVKGSIRGTKWEDLDQDGHPDTGEPVIAGWPVFLEGDAQNPIGMMAHTDSLGRYIFTDLKLGTYIITEEDSANWQQTYPGTPDFKHTVTLTLEQPSAFQVNFGNNNLTTTGIRGRKWADLGGSLFAPVDGFPFTVTDDDGEVVAETVSESIDLNGDEMIDPHTETGWYIFPDLSPGAMTVREETPPHWKTVDPSDGMFEGNLEPGQERRFDFLNAPGGPGGNAGTVHFVDWGDLPPPYNTLKAHSGAAHAIGSNIILGYRVDGEEDGQPDIVAKGDDSNRDDEDGLCGSHSVKEGRTEWLCVRYKVPEGKRARLFVWIDFNNNGIFEASERVAKRSLFCSKRFLPCKGGFAFKAPNNLPKTLFARFRVSSALSLQPYGMAVDGEVEDYTLRRKKDTDDDWDAGFDFGDAPHDFDPAHPEFPGGYPTKVERDGAFHDSDSDIHLGDAIDPDVNGQPTILADGDDRDNNNDDDGILFSRGFIALPAPPPANPGTRIYGLVAGTEVTVIPQPSVDGKLDAWIDFNRDGDWDDAGEQVLVSVDVEANPPEYAPHTFSVPSNLPLGYTYARFRYGLTGGLAPGGPGDVGEVEDYLLQILPLLPVTNTNDSGSGSFRQALLDANNDPGVQVVSLAALGKNSNPILLQAPLPPLTDPVLIDGYGIAILDGTNAGSGANGLVLQAGRSTIKGISIQGFDGHGLVIEGENHNLVQDNTISANNGDGIRVATGVGHTFSRNLIFANRGLSIDLGGDGLTPNDSGDQDGGPNLLQNFPVLTDVSDGSTVIAGSLTGEAEALLHVEFFANPTCGGRGEGNHYLGAASIALDASGQSDFEVSFDTTFTVPNFITATATDVQGNTSELSPCSFELATGEGAGQAEMPLAFQLYPNYPNPFNPTTKIRFDVPEPVRVRLLVFNVLGQVVTTLTDMVYIPGTHQVDFDAGQLPSGLYFYRMEARGYIDTRSMMLIK